MSNDTAFATEAHDNGSGQDAAFDDLYDGLDQAPEADLKLSNEPVPSFAHYVVEARKAKGGFTSEANIPQIRIPAVVLEGPEGTVGESVFLVRYLSVPKQKTVKQGDQRVKVARTPEEYQAAKEEFQQLQQRIAKQLGFAQVMPARPMTEQTLDTYASQFEGKKFVIEIRLEKEQGPYPARNSAQWQSIRALDYQVIDKRTKKARGSAHDVAREEIKRAAERASQGKGRSTSAAQAAAQASPFGR